MGLTCLEGQFRMRPKEVLEKKVIANWSNKSKGNSTDLFSHPNPPICQVYCVAREIAGGGVGELEMVKKNSPRLTAIC